MDNEDLAVITQRQADGLHLGTTGRIAVARASIIYMARPEAQRTMVAVFGAGGKVGDYGMTVQAPKRCLMATKSLEEN